MTKRLIEIEDRLLDRARQVLGTGTIKETVATALEQAVQSRERRTRLTDTTLERFAAAAKDLADDEVMADAWQ